MQESDSPSRLGPVREELQHLFPVRLRLARRARNMKQAELARKIELKPSSIAHLEGGRSLPGLPNLFLIAQALNISTDFLLGLEDTLQHQEDPALTELVRAYALMSPDDRELLLRFVERLTTPQGGRDGDEGLSRNATKPVPAPPREQTTDVVP